MATVRPVGRRVLVERDAPEAETQGGLWLRPGDRLVQVQCTVLAIGPDVQADGLLAAALAPGRRCLVDWHHGAEVVVGGRLLTFVDVADVLATWAAGEDGAVSMPRGARIA